MAANRYPEPPVAGPAGGLRKLSDGWFNRNIVCSRPGRTAALALVMAALVMTVACSGGNAPTVSGTGAVTVDLSGRTLGTLPARYLGLSFESSSTFGTGDFEDPGNLPRLLEISDPGC